MRLLSKGEIYIYIYMDNSKLQWRELVRFFRCKYQMANGVWLKHTLTLELMDPFCLSMSIIIVFTSEVSR